MFYITNQCKKEQIGRLEQCLLKLFTFLSYIFQMVILQ